MILTRLAVAGVGLTMVGAAGCAGGSPSGSGATGGEATIVATTSIWADITSEVACGADIPALIPAGADPHGYEPSLRDRELLDHAAVVVANGRSLEAPLLDLLTAVSGDSDVRVLEMSSHADVLGDDTGGDPHLWQDPRRVAGVLDAIATAVASQALPTCTDAYLDELTALDDEIEQLLSPIPPADRVLVTSHDSLAYFADRYGFEIVGTVIPSTSTLAEASAADLADLADTIERLGVPAIFTEELESTADADALADRLGITVVPLVTDALLDDPGADTYVEMMRANSNAIADALAP